MTVIMKYCVVAGQSCGIAAESASQIGMLRDRQHELDHALDREVDAAAVVARDAAEHDADEQREEDADEAERERDLRPLHDAAPDTAPEPVGAEQEQRLARDRWRRSKCRCDVNRPKTEYS